MARLKPHIPQELWPDIQAMQHADFTLRQIAEWLFSVHAIDLDLSTISRTLTKIRELAPPPEPPKPLPLAPNPPALTVTLEPQSEEDELKLIRKKVRDMIFDDKYEAKDQLSAIRVLLGIVDKKVADRKPKKDKPATSDLPAPASWAPTFGVIKN